MTTFITTYETTGSGPRLAVKDLIDMAGEVTTAGCRAVAETAQPATEDAACLAGALAADARIVGRTNLHELALGVTGINRWYGTPVNPLDPRLVPGGSSSGSAVAVANDDADVDVAVAGQIAERDDRCANDHSCGLGKVSLAVVQQHMQGARDAVGCRADIGEVGDAIAIEVGGIYRERPVAGGDDFGLGEVLRDRRGGQRRRDKRQADQETEDRELHSAGAWGTHGR